MKKTVRIMPCEVMSRVVGYYRPISCWNDGKQKEFSERNLLTLKTEYTNKINLTPEPILDVVGE
jgi:hypothetical protein